MSIGFKISAAIVILAIACISLSSFAQNTDSLENMLSGTEGAEKVHLLHKLSEAFKQSSPEAALNYAELEFEKATELNMEYNVADSYMDMGNALWLMYSYDKSIEKYKKALSLYKNLGDSLKMALACNNIGAVHKDNMNFNMAIEWHNQALDIRRAIDDRKGLAESLNNIGSAYWNLKNMYKALEYYQRSLEIRQEINDQQAIASSLNNLAMVFKDMGYFDEALAQYFESLKISKEQNDKKLIAISLNNIGSVYWNTKNYSKSIEYYLKSLEIREELGDKKDIAGSLNNIGNVYKNLSNYDQAMEFYLRALDIRRSIGDQSLISYSLNDIGGVCWLSKNYDEALDYYTQALEIREQLGDKLLIANSYKNIGIVYKDKGDTEKAVENYNRALDIYKNMKDLKGQASVLNYIGNLERKRGNFNTAIESYSKSFEISSEENDLLGQAYTLLNLGELYLEKNNKKEAISNFEKSLQIAKELEDKNLIKSIYRNLSETYASSSKFEKAYEYYKYYSDFMDELLAEESSKKIADMQNRYEAEKKEKILELVEKENLLEMEKKKGEIEKQKRLIYFFIIGLVIVLAFLITIYRNYRIKKQANSILSQQKEDLRAKNKVITDSISYAKRIQDALFPSGRNLRDTFNDHFIIFKPRDIVSGDFYWLYKTEDKILFAVADCTGHGVPGAFMSMIGNALLNEIVKEKKFFQPSVILDKLNKGVIHVLNQGNDEMRIHNDGMDITLCTFDRKTRILELAIANHYAFIKSGNAMEEIKGDSFSIGEIPRNNKDFRYTNHSIKITEETTLYMFTDGFVDQFGGPENKKFMKSKFQDLLVECSNLNPEEQKEKIVSEFTDWKGERKQIDDVTVIGLKFS